MTDHVSARNSAITSDERIRNTLRRHIRKALDTHAFTRDTLASESGINIHQIDAITTRDPAKHRRIAAEDALCLAYTLGDDTVNALLAEIRYAASRLDEAETLNVGSIVATGLQHFTTIALAAADGLIDHRERPACQDAADHIIATVMPLASAGHRP